MIAYGVANEIESTGRENTVERNRPPLQQTGGLLDVPHRRTQGHGDGLHQRSSASAGEPSGEGDEGIHQAAFKHNGRPISKVI